MNSNQIIILSVFLGYLLFNVIVSFVYSRKAEKSLNTSEEKKYFIGGRNMNGIVLAMTIMATYTSASSFISGPGAAGLANNLPNVYNDIFSKYTPGGLLSFWILVGFGTLGLPQTAVRAMGFKNTKSMHQAMWIGVLTCSFVIVGMHLAGTWAGAFVDVNNLPTSDYFIPYIVQKIMPTGVAAIFLAAPMAAVMSTADSLLILATAAIVKDLWKNYVVKDDPEKNKSYEKNVKSISTVITIILGIVVMVLTINPPDIIFVLNMFAFGGLECTFFWPLVGGLFWKKGTKQAAVCSSVGAIATYIFATYFINIAGLNAVVWGLLVGGILYFGIGMVTGRKGLDPDILDKCF